MLSVLCFHKWITSPDPTVKFMDWTSRFTFVSPLAGLFLMHSHWCVPTLRTPWSPQKHCAVAIWPRRSECSVYHAPGTCTARRVSFSGREKFCASCVSWHCLWIGLQRTWFRNSHFSCSRKKIFYSILFYSILFYSIALHCIVLYCIVLYCIVLYCIVLYCIVLYCL